MISLILLPAIFVGQIGYENANKNDYASGYKNCRLIENCYWGPKDEIDPTEHYECSNYKKKNPEN